MKQSNSSCLDTSAKEDIFFTITMKLNPKNIFLILLLLCTKSYAVCYDVSGKEYFCSSVISTEEHKSDSCPCHCEEEECEEAELDLEILPTKSVEASEVSTDLSYSKRFLLINRDLFRSDYTIPFRHGTHNGLDPSPGLKRVVLTGVVILQ
jgi:hypothetical protein